MRKATSFWATLVLAAQALWSLPASATLPVTLPPTGPTVLDMTPTFGMPGAVISLSGSGFTGLKSGMVGTAPITSIKVISDNAATFTVPTGATSGTVSVANDLGYGNALVAFDVLPVSSKPPAITISGNRFVNASGKTVQLRGVNFSGMESVAVQGWSPTDPTGGAVMSGQAGGPKWFSIAAWKANVVRIPLNEASWLGYTCVDINGAPKNPDPGANYKDTVAQLIAGANAAGLYVILDLHWSAPGSICPMMQIQMADKDHSIDFWTSVANTFKSNPSVMFELFNEPYPYIDFIGPNNTEADQWNYIMKGTNGTFYAFPANGSMGISATIAYPWSAASYQDMINAVRNTGATNPVLVAGISYAQKLDGWLANKPTDPLNKMAAVVHLYPHYNVPYSSTGYCTSGNPAAYACPNAYPDVYTNVQTIISAGIPVVATEIGDQSSNGTPTAPLVSDVSKLADSTGMGVIAWTWDTWGSAQNCLIKDVSGTPTDGEGVAYKAWLVNHP